MNGPIDRCLKGQVPRRVREPRQRRRMKAAWAEVEPSTSVRSCREIPSAFCVDGPDGWSSALASEQVRHGVSSARHREQSVLFVQDTAASYMERNVGL